MFLELKDDNYFKQYYFDILKYKLAGSSLNLEKMNSNISSIGDALNVVNQLSAINYIFNENIDYDHMEFMRKVCEIVKLVSGGEISDFRKTKADVYGSKLTRSKPNMIRNDLYYLIDEYNYKLGLAKRANELFEVEAYFHMRFLHIHPFEDANGRTARILLTYNLSKHNLAPCIITEENKKAYCNLIENSDVLSLADFFYELSIKELNEMVAVYKNLDDRGLLSGNKMTKEQEERYKKKIRYMK